MVPSDIVRTFAAFLEACYIARREVIDDQDITKFCSARTRFHCYREVFRESGVRPEGFSLPRQHSIDHYDQHVMNFGAPNGLCTSITEAKHIKAVKEPWRRSNRFEPLGQMLITNQRLDKLSAARADFAARGMLSGTCLGTILAALQLEREAANAEANTHGSTARSDCSNDANDSEDDTPELDLYDDDPYTDPPELEEDDILYTDDGPPESREPSPSSEDDPHGGDDNGVSR